MVLSISSMTGFARQNDEFVIGKQSFSWYFELKSVNGKSLDAKIKTPSWLENVNIPLRNMLSKYFARGNISVYLDISSSTEGKKLKIDEDLLEALATKSVEIYANWTDQLARPSVSELMMVKGVIEVEEQSLTDEEQAALQGALLASFENACFSLQNDRRNEGTKMQAALLDIVKKIGDVVAKIEDKAADLPNMLKEKLAQQVKMLSDIQISEDRLAQEIVILATKADIKEEIDRLKAHLKTAEELLNSGEAVGRRLDFLCQELNREANTTCSKACDIELTNCGMNLKTLIEQLREQVQNIE